MKSEIRHPAPEDDFYFSSAGAPPLLTDREPGDYHPCTCGDPDCGISSCCPWRLALWPLAWWLRYMRAVISYDR